MRLNYFILILAVLMSCQNKEKTKPINVDFFSDEISKYYGTRKILDLNIKFSECGEWGGHEENIFITTKNDENFHLHYQKYSVDCENFVLTEDSIGTYSAPYKELKDSCSIIMSQDNKNSIYKFSQCILSAKFREKFSDHAGNIFNIRKYQGFTGSEFNIHVYGFDSILVKDYNQLLNELNLPILKKESSLNN